VVTIAMPGGQGQVRFGILGPVEIWTADGVQHVERPLRTAVLAYLLLRAGHLVTVDQLEEALWGGTPPATARPQIHAAVSRIRRVLREAGCAEALATRPGGYELTVGHGHLDLAVFDDHGGRARQAVAGSRYEVAVEQFRRALGLWRGPALGGATAAFVAAARERLEDKRLVTFEDLADAELALGRHAALTAELGAQVDLHPLRERLTGQLMLALYRAGRPAEALEAFHRLRTQLADQLGIDPSRELRERHAAILRADPSLDWAPSQGVVVSAGSGLATPRELPGDVAGFTGREAPLAELDALLDKALDKGRPGSAMVICAISGTAGVGKTALAVHWAHRVADRFPDGQLYVDLRGYHPDQPMPPEQALAALLNSLGVSTMDIPVDVAGRAARYRTALAGRRALVVLDNVHSADQARPLLPGTPSCVVVVTSRGDLAGLVARDGARRLALDALSPKEAVRLLHTLIGERVAAEPVAAALLAQRCARLPLPLRIAAELAVSRPDTLLAQLADDLREQGRRLDLLDTGDDPHTAARAVLSWSHRHLPPEVAATFGRLGLHPGETFDAYAVAALAGVDPAAAEERLRELTRAHLIEPHGAQRLRMHDLLRAYAAERARIDLAGEQAQAALTRLLDYYLFTATAAVDTAFPAERANLPRPPRPATPGPVVETPEAALDWLNRERPNLVAAGIHGRPEHSIHLSQVLWRYLDEHPEDALAVHSAAVMAAPQEHPGRPRALTNLGVAYWRNGRPEDALERLHEAVKGHKENGDRRGEARALGNIGLVLESLGRFTEALDHDRQVRDIYRETGDRRHEIGLLINLGALCVRSGRPAEAAEHQREAVALARAMDDRRLEGHILIGLGAACEGLGEYEEARHHLERALAISREYNHRRNEGFALGGLGQVHLGLGHYAAALEHHEKANAIGREVGDRLLQTEALNSLGDTLRAMGNPSAALERHHEALDLAHQTGDRPEEARALEGLAHALHGTGDRERAERHWRDALAIYTDMHLPQADRLRAHLAGVGIFAR